MKKYICLDCVLKDGLEKKVNKQKICFLKIGNKEPDPNCCVKMPRYCDWERVRK